VQKQVPLIPMIYEDSRPFEGQSEALRNTTTGAQLCVATSFHLVLSRQSRRVDQLLAPDHHAREAARDESTFWFEC